MSDSYYNDLCAKAHPSMANAELSVRLLRCLLSWRPNITLEQAGKLTKEEFMRIPGVGRKSYNELQEAYQMYVAPELFVSYSSKETKAEQYARRTAEALEGILAEMRRVDISLAPPEMHFSADDLHELKSGRR